MTAVGVAVLPDSAHDPSGSSPSTLSEIVQCPIAEFDDDEKIAAILCSKDDDEEEYGSGCRLFQTDGNDFEDGDGRKRSAGSRSFSMSSPCPPTYPRSDGDLRDNADAFVAAVRKPE